MKIDGAFPSVRCTIGIYNQDTYCAIASLPVNADANNHQIENELMHFLLRVNFGCKFGRFDYDARDDEIRYWMGMDCSGVVPFDQMLLDSILIPALTIEQVQGVWRASCLAA